jgi:hypothetical protein
VSSPLLLNRVRSVFDVGRCAGLVLAKIRIVACALQDERDDQILFVLEMPQQGSIEIHDLSGKPFGRAQRIAVSARERSAGA